MTMARLNLGINPRTENFHHHHTEIGRVPIYRGSDIIDRLENGGDNE
jgi:hypothetical protein